MDQNILFRWIWRFNAIALAAFLGLTVLAYLPLFVWLGAPVVERVTGPATEPAAQQSDLRFFLDFQREGRREVVFMLAPELFAASKILPRDESKLGANIADTTRVANYLFIDPATGTGRWLFPTNNQVITATDYVTKNLSTVPAVTDRGPPLAVVYDVKQLTPARAGAASTKYTVYVSKLDGTNLTKILDELDEVALFVPAEDNTIVMTYKRNGRQMFATVSLADFKVLMNKDLSEYAQK